MLAYILYRESLQQALAVWQPPNEGSMRCLVDSFIQWVDEAVGIPPYSTNPHASSTISTKSYSTPSFETVVTRVPVPTYYPVREDYHHDNPSGFQYICLNIRPNPFEPPQTQEDICLPSWVGTSRITKDFGDGTYGALAPWTPPSTSPSPPPIVSRDIYIALVSTILAGFLAIILLLALLVYRELHHKQEKVTIRQQRDRARYAVRQAEDDLVALERRVQIAEKTETYRGHKKSVLENENEDLRQDKKSLEHRFELSAQMTSSLKVRIVSLENELRAKDQDNAVLTEAQTALEQEVSSLLTQLDQKSREADVAKAHSMQTTAEANVQPGVNIAGTSPGIVEGKPEVSADASAPKAPQGNAAFADMIAGLQSAPEDVSDSNDPDADAATDSEVDPEVHSDASDVDDGSVSNKDDSPSEDDSDDSDDSPSQELSGTRESRSSESAQKAASPEEEIEKSGPTDADAADNQTNAEAPVEAEELVEAKPPSVVEEQADVEEQVGTGQAVVNEPVVDKSLAETEEQPAVEDKALVESPAGTEIPTQTDESTIVAESIRSKEEEKPPGPSQFNDQINGPTLDLSFPSVAGLSVNDRPPPPQPTAILPEQRTGGFDFKTAGDIKTLDLPKAPFSGVRRVETDVRQPFSFKLSVQPLAQPVQPTPATETATSMSSSKPHGESLDEATARAQTVSASRPGRQMKTPVSRLPQKNKALRNGEALTQPTSVANAASSNPSTLPTQPEESGKPSIRAPVELVQDAPMEDQVSLAEASRDGAVAAAPSPAPAVVDMPDAPVAAGNPLTGLSLESMTSLQNAIAKVVPAEESASSPMPPRQPPVSVESPTAPAPTPVPALVPGTARQRLQELADGHDGHVRDEVLILMDYADQTVMDHADDQAYLTAVRNEAVAGIQALDRLPPDQATSNIIKIREDIAVFTQQLAASLVPSAQTGPVVQEQAPTQEAADPGRTSSANESMYNFKAMLAALNADLLQRSVDAVMQEEAVSEEAQQAIDTLPVLPSTGSNDLSMTEAAQSDEGYTASFEAELEMQKALQEAADAGPAANATDDAPTTTPRNVAQMVAELDTPSDCEDSDGADPIAEEAQVQTEFEKAQARQEAAAVEMKNIIAEAQARRAARDDNAEPETMGMFAQARAAQEAAAAESQKLLAEARAFNHAKAVDTIHENRHGGKPAWEPKPATPAKVPAPAKTSAPAPKPAPAPTVNAQGRQIAPLRRRIAPVQAPVKDTAAEAEAWIQEALLFSREPDDESDGTDGDYIDDAASDDLPPEQDVIDGFHTVARHQAEQAARDLPPEEAVDDDDDEDDDGLTPEKRQRIAQLNAEDESESEISEEDPVSSDDDDEEFEDVPAKSTSHGQELEEEEEEDDESLEEDRPAQTSNRNTRWHAQAPDTDLLAEQRARAAARDATARDAAYSQTMDDDEQAAWDALNNNNDADDDEDEEEERDNEEDREREQWRDLEIDVGDE